MGIGTIVGDGVDIDPPVLDGDMSAERTHITFFKLEAIDLQLSVDGGLGEEFLHIGRARGHAVKLHRFEMDQVEDIGHVDIAQRDL